MAINPDFSDMLAALSAEGAERRSSRMAGGHAVMRYTEPRDMKMKNLDLWVRPSPENAARVYRALAAFGAPLTGLVVDDFASPGAIYQVGVAPNRIDIVTSIDGVDFDTAWATRSTVRFGDATVEVPALEVVIRN
jgi:hypothetical protein